MKSMWAIQHVPTGFYLPNPKGYSGRGGSFVEIADPNLVQPRLFISEYAAKRALGAWLRGKHEGKHDWDEGYKYTIGYTIVPVPNRKREEMAVVEIVLQPQPVRTEP